MDGWRADNGKMIHMGIRKNGSRDRRGYKLTIDPRFPDWDGASIALFVWCIIGVGMVETWKELGEENDPRTLLC
jgi:hypothetical protein